MAQVLASIGVLQLLVMLVGLARSKALAFEANGDGIETVAVNPASCSRHASRYVGADFIARVLRGRTDVCTDGGQITSVP